MHAEKRREAEEEGPQRQYDKPNVSENAVKFVQVEFIVFDSK